MNQSIPPPIKQVFMKFAELITEGKTATQYAAENQKFLDDLKLKAKDILKPFTDSDTRDLDFVDEYKPDEDSAVASRILWMNGKQYTVVLGVVRKAIRRYPLEMEEPIYRFDIWNGVSSWLNRKKTGQISKCKSNNMADLIAKLEKSLVKIAR